MDLRRESTTAALLDQPSFQLRSESLSLYLQDIPKDVTPLSSADKNHVGQTQLAKMQRTTDYGVSHPSGCIYNTTPITQTQGDITREGAERW